MNEFAEWQYTVPLCRDAIESYIHFQKQITYWPSFFWNASLGTGVINFFLCLNHSLLKGYFVSLLHLFWLQKSWHIFSSLHTVILSSWKVSKWDSFLKTLRKCLAYHKICIHPISLLFCLFFIVKVLRECNDSDIVTYTPDARQGPLSKQLYRSLY
jgi:hypothetical protein